MADGTKKRLDQVRPGDWIVGGFEGKDNLVHGVEVVPLGDRNFWLINDDLLMSDEHLIWSPEKGLVGPCPDMYVGEGGHIGDFGQEHPVIIDDKGTIEHRLYLDGADPSFLDGLISKWEIGDVVFIGNNIRTLDKIECLEGAWPPWTNIYTLVGSRHGEGTGNMLLGNEGYWAGCWPNPEYDYRSHLYMMKKKDAV